MFKELKEHGIDKIHSYGKEEYTEEFLYRVGLEERGVGLEREIANPEVKVINKKLTLLRAKKKKMTENILNTQGGGKKAELLAVKRKRTGIERRIRNQIAKRVGLPKKVNLFDRINEENIVRLSDEKKLFFDWLKMNAIWVKREIVDIVKPYYRNLRDVNKFVKSILNSRTYVRRKEDTLYVKFPFQSSKIKHEALSQLCNYLNDHGEIDLGLDYNKLIFGIQGKH